jgi:solute carrier family 35 protein F1/2
MVPIHQDEAVLDYAAVGAGYVIWVPYVTSTAKHVLICITTVLAICITSTNTLSTILNNEGTSIPAFQSFFNYVLLNLIYTSYTIYKYGFKRWVRLCIFEGWRFFILAFFDVEGNYFVVLAYRYVSL